ncbi:hypothetical protein HMPREF9702_05872 [Delftia acidovorans CCUG 15835]|nr:hypothetical protein HMPREF9702_05872 [Delftia acidovorans CCUG 15835]
MMPGDGGEDQVLVACCTLQARLFLLNDKVAEQTVNFFVCMTLAVSCHIPVPKGLDFGCCNVLKYVCRNPCNISAFELKAPCNSSQCH